MSLLWGHSVRGLVLQHGAEPSPSPHCPQGAFPARLKKVFIVGAPMWFRVPYSIISLLLKEKLRERVSVGAAGSWGLGALKGKKMSHVGEDKLGCCLKQCAQISLLLVRAACSLGAEEGPPAG